jgi:4-hydroxy-tetrahydrodipicolinate reductase
MNPIRVAVFGAAGRVGQVLINDLPKEPELYLVGAIDLKASGGHVPLSSGSQIPFSNNLVDVLAATQPQVMVDFTIAAATMPAARTAAARGVNLVIGTTGLSPGDLQEMERLANYNKVGIVVASNFAIGAILMMHFAKIAAKYMDFAEIIELHHHLKADAPSGTALTTASAMAASRGKPFMPAADVEKHYASRGQNAGGINIHSIRLPGLMAHQEVIMGGSGQTLTIRHDTISRECYVPGVVLAIKEVIKRKGLVQGLDTLLNL